MSITERTKKPTREHCKKLWEGNRDYVQQMGASLNISEAVLLAKKQDALYLAWFDGNYNELGFYS